jgi:cell wall-associated NlpC family hydrolase
MSKILVPHLFAAMTAVAVIATTAAPATASPITDKRQQAAQLEAQIAANGDKIAALGERFNGASLELQQANADVENATRRIDIARRREHALRQSVENLAVQLYSGSRLSPVIANLNVSSVKDLAVRTQYASVSAQRDQQTMDSLAAAQEDLAIERKVLAARRAAAVQKRDAIAAARNEIDKANAQEKQLLSRVKGELATLVLQDQQRRDAAARQAALARIAAARSAAQSQGSGSSERGSAVNPVDVGAGNYPNVPPPSARVGVVLAYARAQLGKPYQYAATGPDTFDCSGLTMMAWRQAGVSMNHYSGSQYQQFPHVSLSQLQPGDLVFKGPGGSDHVALYVGGGMQIAATHTGDYVRLQPLSSNLTGAVRPG